MINFTHLQPKQWGFSHENQSQTTHEAEQEAQGHDDQRIQFHGSENGQESHRCEGAPEDGSQLGALKRKEWICTDWINQALRKF